MTDDQLDLPTYPLDEPTYANKRTLDFSAFEDALASLDQKRIATLDNLLIDATVLEIQALMNNEMLSAEELVLYYVERIQRFDVDRLNSVLELNPAALEIARQLDAERAAGSTRTSMHGIPVLLKDNIATGDGMNTAAGAWALREWQPDRDAFLVQQLREAGAVILGKANLSEWANYMDPNMPNGFSVLGGQTRNPYGPFDTFGSSSGSAVAAAANLAAVTVGTETQGSLLMPAGINGVVGLKTSRGLISGDLIIPLVDWMDVAGPMGRTVTDIAVLLSAMIGVDENDPSTQASANVVEADYTQFLMLDAANGMRIGIVVQDDETINELITALEMEEDAAEDFRQAMLDSNEVTRQSAQFFVELGMELVEVPASAVPAPPPLENVIAYGFREALNRFLAEQSNAPVASLAEIVAINAEDLPNRAPYGQGYLEEAENSAVTAEEYAAQVEENRSVDDELSDLFETYAIDALFSNSQVYAAAGFPAISLPMGYDESGSPKDVRLIGDFLGEGKLITIGYALERAAELRQAPDLEQTVAEIDAMTEE